MNNLKRVLSLGLAGTMLTGMMMVGASAAGVENFTDASEIDHAQAVSTMVALNIINGNDDGSFAPDRVVTRAEMAKMITIARNGGRDPVLGVKATPTYTDIKGHWAEKYIEYCSSLKIISGRGDGTFQPDATVTGTEAAKMTLTAMGYDATVFNFTGLDWAINVNTEANNAKLYDKLDSVNPDEGMTRDNAAQLMYNGVLAPGKKMSPSLEITNGNVTYQYQDGPSLFVDKYEGKDETTTLSSFSYDESKGEWTYTLPGTDHGYVTTTEDYTDLYGMKVRVLYKVDDDDSTKTVVYGMFLKDSKVIREGFVGDITSTNVPGAAATEIKIDNVTYKLDSRADRIDVRYYGTGVDTGLNLDDLDDTVNFTNVSPNYSFGNYSYKMLDVDGKGKIDTVYVTPFTVGKITYVGSDSITVAIQNTDADARLSGSRKLEDIDVYDDVAKDDYVMCVASDYAAKDMPTYTKLDIASGTITGTRNSVEYKMDGKWFTKQSSTTLNANDTIDYIALGSVLYYAKVTSGSTGTDALALVYDIANKAPGGVGNPYIEGAIIDASGTKTTAKVVEINGVDVSKQNVSYNVTTGKDASERTPSAFLVSALRGQMVKYEKNSDGELSFWTIPAAYNPGAGNKIMGFDGTIANAQYFDNTTDKVGSYELADDAVVFVYRTDKNAKVYTGKELKNTVATDFGNAAKAGITFSTGVYGKSNGFTYAQAVVLHSAAYPTINTGANYGYLVADAYTSKENGNNYRYFEFWNGTEVVNAKEKDETSISAFKAGTVLTYDITDASEDGNGNITVKNASAPKMGIGTVNGWDGVDKVQISGAANNSKIDNDTVVLYVNSKDQVGVAGGEISEAVDQDGNGTKEDNVLYLEGGDKSFALIVVDVNQEMHANAAQILTTIDNAADTASIETALTSNDVLLTGTVTIDANLSVPAGRTLTVDSAALAMSTNTITLATGAKLVAKNGITGSGLITVNDNATLDVTGAVAQAVTSSGTVSVSGAITGNVTATKGSVSAASMGGTLTLSNNATATVAGAITGNVTASNTSKVKAGTMGGTLTLNHTAEATVSALPTGAATLNTGKLTITGALGASTLPAGTIVLEEAPTGALTLNAASKVTFEKAFDVDTVVANSTACASGTVGAEVTFEAAPTKSGALPIISADGFISNDGTTALTAEGDIVLNVVYKVTQVSSNYGLVKQ